jgi:alpha-ketoglutarate-dependent taurine dioxygenase
MTPDRPDSNSPFSITDDAAYQAWRSRKLANQAALETVAIKDIADVTDQERQLLLRHCQQQNFALFAVARPPQEPEAALRAFGERMGVSGIDQNLCAEDSGVTAITVKPTHTDHVYIPYTNRPLGWHTDGYYNAGSQQIRAWLLYCAQPATEGGANELLDHEIAYIRVRDQNPEWVRALMAADAFTIPSNSEGGEQIRPDETGPVFSVSPMDGSLHMRYSARQRNVIWKDDPATHDAAQFLLDLMTGDERIVRRRLHAGEGVISNNVLHRRDGFRDATDDAGKRLIYRARYYQRLPLP